MKLKLISCLVVCVAAAQAAVLHDKWEYEVSKQSAEISPSLIANINDKKYYFSGKGLYADMKQATRLCLDLGMKLVSIETKQENDAIFDFIRENSLDYFYWTSGRRVMGEFQWVATNAFFSYANWHDWEPNEPDTQVDTCVELFVNLVAWRDYKCDFDQGFICEA